MSNWAIVIGIDQYWTPEACLKGAVRDALRMSRWLVQREGGDVLPRNLTLLLGRSSTSPEPDKELTAQEASYGSVINAIELLLRRSEGKGERFFFYFAGHGLSSRLDFSNQPGILFSDFSDILPTNSLTLQSVFELFQAFQFRDQFFIIDACRNMPWKHEFRLGEYPNPRKPVPPVPPQFIMYATSPGLKAKESQYYGDEGGVFTEALLEALEGKGMAKAWDPFAEEYILRWENVFKYVESQVISKKLKVDDVGRNLIQEPRQAGERGSQNPELGRFPAGTFPKEPLEVNLEPNAAATQAQIVIGDLSGEVERASGITQLPMRFSLEPRTYSVRAAASTFRPEKTNYPIELYGPSNLVVRMRPAPPVLGMRPEKPELTRGLEGVRTPGSITVRSDDPLVRLELVDNTGKQINAGEGEISSSNLSPGFYRARLITPEGRQVEQLIELLPGENEEWTLEAPKPPDSSLFQGLVTKSGIIIESDNTIIPSEAVGSVATAHVSTLLALAGGAANEDSPYGEKLRRIGISSFQTLIGKQAESGVQILFGIEGQEADQVRDYASQVKLRCWPQSQAMPDTTQQALPVPSFVELAEFAWDLPPGSHWLSIQEPDQRPVMLALTVLPKRLALVVFHRDAHGEVNIYQYLPALVAGEPNDPRQGLARFPVLQRSELIQREYLSGRLREPGKNAIELLYAKCVEPIAGCLGGYILLKVNPDDENLRIAAGNMARFYGELSDSHVIQAEYLAHRGRDEQAREAYRAALERGLPVLSDGLERLVDGIQRYNIEHPQVEFVKTVYKNRVRGLLWTAVPVMEDTAPMFEISGVTTKE